MAVESSERVLIFLNEEEELPVEVEKELLKTTLDEHLDCGEFSIHISTHTLSVNP